MANLEVVELTRTSIVLEWDFNPRAVAYRIERQDPPQRDGDPPPDRLLLAAVYSGVFCDVNLTPGTRYSYLVTMMPDPAIQPPERDVEEVTRRTLPETEFPDARAFFADFMAGTFQRRLGSVHKWCEEWWRHPEAAYVVEQLWCSYEALRPPDTPAGPTKHRAEWLVGYFYPLFDRLLSPTTTFDGCAVSAAETDDGVLHQPRTTRLPEAVAALTMAP